MMDFLCETAHAMGGQPGTGGQTQGSPFGFMLPFLAIFAIFYFLVIRPESQKKKALQRQIEEMKKGDKVITIGGIHGVIAAMKDDTIILQVSEKNRLEIQKSAVARVIADKSGAEKTAVSYTHLRAHRPY